MSHAATIWRYAALAALTSAAVWAQASLTPASAGMNWRRLGRPSMNTHLAGAATGAIQAVWYSPDGGRLFAQTASGRVFETADLETWSKSDATPPEKPEAAVPAQKPESQALVITAVGDERRYWSLGRALFSSSDGGVSWTNLSGPGDGVIGTGQHAVAVRPDDPSVFAVANDAGVWQSPDGGQTWSGLNENLPNLPVNRILSTSRGAVKVRLEDGRSLQLTDALTPWSEVESDDSSAGGNDVDARDRQQLQATLGAEITAIARKGDLAYAGSDDGRLWVSRDRGATWNLTQAAGRGSVERIYVDSDAPRAAVAVLSGPGARLLRTVNTGAVWDDITGNLSDIPVHGIVADRASGAAYVATDRGVYVARVDMNAFAPASAWQLLGGSLPAARAVDVSLDATGRQLYVALDGYGLYTALAPVRNGVLRITNAADFSSRPAAPGSVISVLGGKVTAAQAGGLKFPVLASGETESQLQVPFEANATTVDLAVNVSRGSVTLPLAIRSVSPAIFVDPDGVPFLVDADSGLALDAGSAARPRTRLQLMATGLGRVQPDWQTGVPAPAENPPSVVANVKAYLDGEPLEVTKATLAPGYVGYYLIEVQLPEILNAGPAEFYISADGQDSNKVRLRLDSERNTATE